MWTLKSHSHRLKQLKVCVCTTTTHFPLPHSHTHAILPWCLFFPHRSYRNWYLKNPIKIYTDCNIFIYCYTYFIMRQTGTGNFLHSLKSFPRGNWYLFDTSRAKLIYIHTHINTPTIYFPLHSMCFYWKPCNGQSKRQKEKENTKLCLSGKVHHRFSSGIEKHANCDTGNQ